MGKYLEPVCRLCRREGIQLFLKGTRCLSHKCAVVKRKKPPGFIPIGAISRKLSDFGVELREKQKVKRMYGGLRETQFLNTFRKAEKKKGKTGDRLLEHLERRLDSILVRSHFAVSYAQAKQYINHGHFLVNKKKVDIASCVLNQGDCIQIKEQSKITNLIRENLKALSQGKAAEWLRVDENKLECEVLALPQRQEINIPVNEQLIVEFYSK